MSSISLWMKSLMRILSEETISQLIKMLSKSLLFCISLPQWTLAVWVLSICPLTPV